MNDIDIWQKAVDNMDLNESVQFISKSGYLVTEESQVEMYNKIQKLLNCNEIECSHRWLYLRDPSELTEAEATKVNNLYKLACEKGYIEDQVSEEDVADDVSECDMIQEPVTEQPHPFQQQIQQVSVPTSAFTILYSAMRNGNVATGEAYSNSMDPRSAKADVISKLERAGYSNISILAIECGDPDCAGKKDAPNTYIAQADMTPIQSQSDIEIPDYSNDIYEADKKDDAAEDALENNDEKDDTADLTEQKDSDSKEKNSDEDSEDDAKKDEVKEQPKKDVKKEEDPEEPDEKLKSDTKDDEEDKELDASEKAQLKDSYKKAFKAAMLNCKFENMAFEDLSLQLKVDLFTVLSKAWGSKTDPTKFMTDKEIDQLEKIVIKK